MLGKAGSGPLAASRAEGDAATLAESRWDLEEEDVDEEDDDDGDGDAGTWLVLLSVSLYLGLSMFSLSTLTLGLGSSTMLGVSSALRSLGPLSADDDDDDYDDDDDMTCDCECDCDSESDFEGSLFPPSSMRLPRLEKEMESRSSHRLCEGMGVVMLGADESESLVAKVTVSATIDLRLLLCEDACSPCAAPGVFGCGGVSGVRLAALGHFGGFAC